MAAMPGMAVGSASGRPTMPVPPPAPDRPAEKGLFEDLVVSVPQGRRGLRGTLQASFAAHVILVGSAILVPILWPAESPEHTDYIKALIYNPPPPPPPPLPKGAALQETPKEAKPVTPEVTEKPKVTPDLEVPREAELKPEPRAHESEQSGSPTGSDIGVPEGMDVGVEGGVVGGVPGGVLGGVVGGTGDGPVVDYDQPPRLLSQPRLVYPQEAFIKKIEGTVNLEILIDVNGRVVRARVLQGVPMLNEAALQHVQQWTFAPAVKGGRPVSTIALAPVKFRIY